MKKLKYLLFVFVIFICQNVFAQDFTVENSKITSPNGGGRTGTYTGTEIYNSGTSNVYNIGTRYNGRLSRIVFNLIAGGYADPNGFEKGHNYTLTLNMATDDWRNKFGNVSVTCEASGSNLSNGRVTYVSYRKIKFSFTTPSDTYCQFVYVDLKSTNISTTAFTGVSNWNLSSMVISDPSYGATTGSGSGGSGSSDSTNTDIINNNNQNTENIINNNNQNTQDIIENNNNNTQEIKETITENLNNCRNSYNVLNPDILSIGGISTETGELGYGFFIITNDYIPIDNDNSYYSFRYNTYDNPQIVVFKYGSNHNFLGFDVIDSTSGSLSISNQVKFIRVRYNGDFTNSFNFQVEAGQTVHAFEEYGTRVCTSKLDDTTSAINEVNNSINNSNIDNGLGSSFFSGFTDQDFGLSQIITIPLNTIQSLTSQSCVPLQLPIPFTNSTVSLPCMTQIYESKLPTIYNLWKIVSFGIVAYLIAIDIFHIVKGFKDPESDKVEVLDL